MNFSFQQFKVQFKKAVKMMMKAARKILAPVLIIVLIALIVAGGLDYVVTQNDGSYKEGDKSNVPYSVTQYTSEVYIDSDGTIRTSISAQELWDEMVLNNTRIDEYLDDPEELAKLMNAEIITNYPDTRSADEIDEPLDEEFWDSLNEDVESTETQGIIKFIRDREDGTSSTLTYVSPEVFESYIENYNLTGSDEYKELALSHFTIEQQYTASSVTAGTISAGTVIDIPEPYGTAYTYMGWQKITSTTSNQYRLREQAGQNFDSEGFGIINGRYVIACTSTFGQVGDYIDFYLENGIVLPCIIGDIKNQNDDGCNQWGHNNGAVVVEFVVDMTTWYNEAGTEGAHENPGTSTCHPEWNSRVVKAVNGGSYFDNPSFGVDTIEGNESSNSDDSDSTTSSNVLKWPTDGTTITSYFGLRDAPIEGASTDHGAIDIGVATGTNVYAAADGTVTTACYDDSAGYMIVIDHGGGFETRYYHNSQLLVSAGDTVTKGDVIAKSGSTGTSTGPHVHFETRQNGVKVDPLSYKYDNGMGSGTGTYDANASYERKYVVKVAKWSERFEESVPGENGNIDPEPVKEYIEANTTYTMTTQTIDYQSMVSGYQMPFDYLWQWLVIGGEKEFVLEVADLIYGSEIEITIHDNVTTVTDVDTYDYYRQTKVDTHDINVTGTGVNVYVIDEFGNTTETTHTIDVSSDGRQEELDPTYYEIIHTVITSTDSLNVSLTKADVWIVEYTQEFTYEPTDTSTVVSDPADLPENRDYPDSPDEANVPNEDPAGIAAEVRASATSGYTYTRDVSTTCLTDYYYKLEGTITNENTISANKYTSSPKNIVPKDDKYSDEPNFVTILIDTEHRQTLRSVISASDWLFALIEENERTVDLLDLTKYLLYKATGKDYGVTEYDFETFDPANFSTVGSIYGTVSGIDGIQGEIYDFFLAKGIPPAGVAAIMGNIEGESSFDTANSNGSHYGLVQWGGDRFTGLQAYASSKGTEWTDLQTQLEYIWQELEGGYSNVKDVLMATTDESDIEYATWYFGRYYEIFFSYSNSFEASKSMTYTRYQYALNWYQAWNENHTLAGGTVYYQDDYSNISYGGGTIATSGCGPTCFAMIATDYTGTTITPVDAISWCGNRYYVSGVGTSWEYFNAAAEHFNLPCTVVDLGNDINAAISELQKGNLVISSQSAGLFTSGGHFILLSSYENGGIRVRDPNKNNAVNKGYADRLFTPSEIHAASKNYWSFQR